MKIKIIPKTLVGTVEAISSKSHAHRLLIAAALSDRPDASVQINTVSADIEATENCLAKLSQETPVFDCQESGSTLRFLLPVAMVLKNRATFLGSGRLPQRPVSPLKEQMEAHGCRFFKSQHENQEEIFTVEGSMTGGTFTLPGNVSSQYITGLLFALPLLPENSRIVLTTSLESAGYVNLTLQVLKDFGIQIETEEDNGYYTFLIPGNQKYQATGQLKAEGDWSNSAFWIIGGILPSFSAVTCRGLDLHSLQGDKAIARLAQQFGGQVLIREDQIMTMSGVLTAQEIDASAIPDLVPILAVAASVSAGTTTIYNAGRLRIKESDRLAAVTDCLTRLGADITELPDGLQIRGVAQLKGGAVSGYNDHRIVMAMAIASVCCMEPVIIEGAEAVNKSYPGFFEDFQSLGGEIHVI